MRLIDLGIYALLPIAVGLILWYKEKLEIERKQQRIQELTKEISEHENSIHEAYEEYNAILHSGRYISKSAFPAWVDKWEFLRDLVNQAIEFEIEFENENEVRALQGHFQDGVVSFQLQNERFIIEELEKNKELFDTIEDHPLTDNQRKTIIVDEKNNLVVAGAGTGKTSTVIGKAGYLLKNGYARANDLLLIAFARKAKEEMFERGIVKIQEKLNVTTFHSLGRSIIGTVEGEMPSLSTLSGDRSLLNNTLKDFLQLNSENPSFQRKLNQYFAFHNTPYVSEFHFETKGDYIDYIKENEIRSLKGDLVKSFEELEIANFLYLNGIEYQYEAPYEVRTATSEYGQYKPDFYLPDSSIYMEHFGINRNNETAPWIDTQSYLESMEWKRKTHTDNNTTLLETYSWQKSEGILLDYLETTLLDKGVEFNPISSVKIYDEINKLGLVHPFTSLLGTFLNLFKSNNQPLSVLYDKARKMPNSKRYTAFLDIFSEIYQEYQDSLGEKIDFNDMINKAESYLRTGEYQSPYTYVLVDEFQDISASRYRLLKSLLQSNTQSKSFCVGDDWQSIFRFTGSDISIMSHFDEHFSPSERLTLDKTFRFNNMLCDVSSKFILENPNQISKQLSTHQISDETAVTLHWTRNGQSIISEIVDSIKEKDDKTSVFILGRYNHQKPETLSKLKKEHPSLNIDYHTIHASKGKQADHVIVLGLTSGKYSFPSQIEDDPIMNLVLSKEESTPYAEERRLFYVALTRAKKHVHLLANPKTPSPFALELEKNGYKIESIGETPIAGIKCPECKTGIIVSKWSSRGEFFACNNYPYCEHIARTCPVCGKGFITKQGGYHVCSTGTCSFNAETCPSCGGYLVKRRGRTQFLGCSNFPNCRFTKEIVARTRYSRFRRT